jgi:hypothetical protein
MVGGGVPALGRRVTCMWSRAGAVLSVSDLHISRRRDSLCLRSKSPLYYSLVIHSLDDAEDQTRAVVGKGEDVYTGDIDSEFYTLRSG